MHPQRSLDHGECPVQAYLFILIATQSRCTYRRNMGRHVTYGSRGLRPIMP